MFQKIRHFRPILQKSPQKSSKTTPTISHLCITLHAPSCPKSPNQKLISACQKSQQRTVHILHHRFPKVRHAKEFIKTTLSYIRESSFQSSYRYVAFRRDVCASSVQDKRIDEIHRSKSKDSKTCSPIILNLLQSKTSFLKHNLSASMYHVARAEAFCRSSRKFTIRNHSLPRNSP